MTDKLSTLAGMKTLLKSKGQFLLLFANRNTLYDAFGLMSVKLTTSSAQYPSVNSLHNLLKVTVFEVGKTEPIESLIFMPTILMVEGILQDETR